MVRFGSVSAQLILRKTTGIAISHKRKGDVCEVNVVSGADLYVFEDDAFMTNCHHIFMELWKRAVTELHIPIAGRVDVQPALVYSNTDVCSGLDVFDESEFLKLESRIQNQELKEIMGDYKKAVAIEVEFAERDYLKADAIYAFFSHLRADPSCMVLGLVKGDNVIPIDQALSCLKEHDTFILGQNQLNLLPILQHVFPHGKQIEDGEDILFLTKVEDPFVIIGSKRMCSDVSKVPINRIGVQVKNLPQATTSQEEVHAGKEEVDDILAMCVEKVAALIRKPEQQCTPDEREFRLHGGFPGFLDETKHWCMSAKGLQGLGKKLGVGPLGDCIMRLAEDLTRTTSRPLSETLWFAAGRLSRMNSNKSVEISGSNPCSYTLRDK